MRGLGWQRRAAPMMAFVAAVALAACGRGSADTSSAAPSSTTKAKAEAKAAGSDSSEASTSKTDAAAAGASSSAEVVAWVAGKPITKASYLHWLSVEQALGVTVGAGHRALSFLITNAWLEDEARARGISISPAEAQRKLLGFEHRSFAKAGSLAAYLAKSRETEADLLARVRDELLRGRIIEQLIAAGTARATSVLASFQRTFQSRWRKRTICVSSYLMSDCSEFEGRSEGSAVLGSANTSGGVVRSTTRDAKADTQPGAGGITIASPAFERAGGLPARYTCDGDDVSPPLRWRNVPAQAAALMLLVIDDSTLGPASGVRWSVGDISPRTKGVAEGEVPAGGVVGADTQGHVGYGGICPSPGQRSTIEFVLVPLRKRIPLTTGFQAAVAESEYGPRHYALGAAAVTYASYRRP